MEVVADAMGGDGSPREATQTEKRRKADTRHPWRISMCKQ